MMYYRETLKNLRGLVNAAEDTHELYMTVLRGGIPNAAAFDMIRASLDKQWKALVDLRGPTHDPYNWDEGLEGVVKVLEAAEEVNEQYLIGLLGHTEALGKLHRALIQLRGPDHNPHTLVIGPLFSQAAPTDR